MTLGNTVGVPRRVLVVGAGFLGTHITHGFVHRGAATTLLARRPVTGDAARRVAGARIAFGDATDQDDLRRALGDADHVVWAAGGLMPADSSERPVDDVRLALPPLLGMLELLVARGGGSITLISSGGTVYGNPTVIPVPEHHLPQPLSAHAVTKVASELYLSVYREVHGLETLALRCANVYGEGQVPHRSQGVVATAFASAATGAEMPLVDGGRAVRDFVYVDDVVDVVCTLAARKACPAIVNVGSGVGTSVTALLALVQEVTGRPVATTPVPARPGDVNAVVLDVTLLRSLMAFEPISLPEGLDHLWRGAAEAGVVAPS